MQFFIKKSKKRRIMDEKPGFTIHQPRTTIHEMRVKNYLLHIRLSTLDFLAVLWYNTHRTKGLVDGES
jgi:hypothetical protein